MKWSNYVFYYVCYIISIHTRILNFLAEAISPYHSGLISDTPTRIRALFLSHFVVQSEPATKLINFVFHIFETKTSQLFYTDLKLVTLA